VISSGPHLQPQKATVAGRRKRATSPRHQQWPRQISGASFIIAHDFHPSNASRNISALRGINKSCSTSAGCLAFILPRLGLVTQIYCQFPSHRYHADAGLGASSFAATFQIRIAESPTSRKLEAPRCRPVGPQQSRRPLKLAHQSRAARVRLLLAPALLFAPALPDGKLNMSGEAWLYLLSVLINAVNLFLQVFFTIMYSDLEW
jgi:hypothetical protein